MWLRELGLPCGAALVGGLAYTLAPYRVAQSAGHLRGPISILIPLALWAFERARRGSRWWLVLAGAAIGSIPFSDLHLALGAVPFFFDIRREGAEDSLHTTPIGTLRFPNRTMLLQVAATIEGVQMPA